MAGRRDPELAKAMDRFVCVRVVQGWGLDLALFQFDWRQTWTMFFLNADRAVYGRFDARQADDLVALRKALEGALELHEKWPANRAELAGKVGPAPRWKVPEEIPALKEKGTFKPAVGRDGCIHCHDILEAAAASTAGTLPARLGAPYPTPQRIGLQPAAGERATVADVDRLSPAEKAGLTAGDRVVRFGGQPVVSWADVQWALYVADDAQPLRIELDRAGVRIDVALHLPSGWRSR